ncbi:MAG: MarR family transcriptional regulator [Gammaproteobacteria bacterium]|nr:MarR family transcriptional regulator [Gammaproteobacteria bacterium]NIW40523.1 MarR family transcriptional regulator [candidate division Zixibacteria bacterium]
MKGNKEQYSEILVEFYERLTSWESAVVADRDISLAQMHLLEILGNHGALRMKELADKLGVTTGTLTVMVHRLVSKGYLEKEKDPMDKRSYFIKLTSRGRAEYDYHHHMHSHLIEEIMDALGEESSKNFFSNLTIIQNLM